MCRTRRWFRFSRRLVILRSGTGAKKSQKHVYSSAGSTLNALIESLKFPWPITLASLGKSSAFGATATLCNAHLASSSLETSKIR